MVWEKMTSKASMFLRLHTQIDLTRHAIEAFPGSVRVHRGHGIYSPLLIPISPSGIHIVSRSAHGTSGQRPGFIKSLTPPRFIQPFSTRVEPRSTSDGILPDTYNDLRFGPEGKVIVDMVTQDDYSVARAVEAIVSLTSRAAFAAARSSPDDPTDVPLYHHADNVALSIHGLSRRLRHDQQSKLIEFCIQLQQQAVPDLAGTGVLKNRYRMDFWTDMPEIGTKIADYKTIGTDVGDVEDDGHQLENFTAWLAQLSELKFLHYKEGITWSHPALTHMFRKGYQPTGEDVRVMCMWFIYAPSKVWTDAQTRRTEKIGLYRKKERFQPEYWSQWKLFLQDFQGTSLERLVDEYTQELIRLALRSIEELEGRTSKAEQGYSRPGQKQD